MSEIIKNPNNPEIHNDHDIISQEFYYSGPLPPPSVLAHFEKVLPGSAQKILDMSLEQNRHRHELEKQVIGSDIKDSRLGLVFA